MILLETFWVLLRDPAHWEFELFLILLFDGVIGALVWPFVRRHIHRDVRAAEQHDHELIRLLAERVGALESSTGVPGQTFDRRGRDLLVAQDIATRTWWCPPDFARVYEHPALTVIEMEYEEVGRAEPQEP